MTLNLNRVSVWEDRKKREKDRKKREKILSTTFPGPRVIAGQLVGCRGGDGIIRLGKTVLCKDCGYSPCKYDANRNVGRLCSGCGKLVPPEEYDRPNARYCHNCKEKRRWASASIISHKNGGYDVQFTMEELYEAVKTGRHCHLCGIELDFTFGVGLKINSPTVDRVHNGHVMNIQNVEILCHQCNTAKGRYPVSEFIERCKRVAYNFDEVTA